MSEETTDEAKLGDAIKVNAREMGQQGSWIGLCTLYVGRSSLLGSNPFMAVLHLSEFSSCNPIA